MTTAAQPQVAGRDTPLTLAELIDLEVQLAKDADGDPRELVDRDGAIAERIDASRLASSRHSLLRQWLAAAGASGPGSVGRRIQTYYRVVGWVASVVALFGGAGTAAALLHYDGHDPVNIIGFLAVLVGIQLLLMAVIVLTMLPAPWRKHVVPLTGIQELVRDLGYRSSGLLGALRIGDRIGSKGAAAFGKVTALHGIYVSVERWSLTALTQRVGIAFNVGALSVCLYLVTVRALAFAWSTTLEVNIDTMTRLFHAIAAPWRWLPSAVPDRELIEVSRYFPGRPYDADRLGDWWPFLFAAVVTYGLLPRLLLATYASYRERAARRALALDHGECALVYARLLRSAGGWGPGAEVGVQIPREDREGVEVAAVPLPTSEGSVRLVRWADAALTREGAERVIAGRYRWHTRSFDPASGDGSAAEAALLGRLGADPDRSPVLLLAEAWEPPSKNLLHFVRAVRASIGKDVAIVVGLLTKGAQRPGASTDDLRIWRRRIAALGDPRIRVEALDA